MAGMIKPSDIEYVKAQSNIVDIISDHVALKSAGIDSMKGLCPFHDERSPSFHVKPSLGYFHCFGCGESGDVISFLQKINHLTFTESVEMLAAKVGYELEREAGDFRPRQGGITKTRILEANLKASTFFKQCLATQEAQIAKTALVNRGFDEEALARFDVGYSPKSWDSLKKHLISQGFTETELIDAGLLSKSDRGSYDRFRGRLMWPIKDTGGHVIGFGARKVYDDDQGPKYLNTPETLVYHKSKVLYGIDSAKRSISGSKSVVVVEGYTDVMACHLAGVDTAVATCGTAFGRDHISLLRRVMGDDQTAKVIFTFDPDEAGQKAALKAYADEHLFSAQTYVAVPPEGLDPSDLRQHHGDEALKQLFENIQPLFSFALNQAVNKFDLNTVEGRTMAMRNAAPILHSIRDSNVREGYIREVSINLGVDIGQVRAAVNSSQPGHQSADPVQTTPTQAPPQRASTDPRSRLEYDAMTVMVQHRDLLDSTLIQQAVSAAVYDPNLQTIQQALAKALTDTENTVWFQKVLKHTPQSHKPFLNRLAMSPLPQNDERMLPVYARGVVTSLVEQDLISLKQEMVVRLQRLNDSTSAEYRRTQEQIKMLEHARRTLQEQAGLG